MSDSVGGLHPRRRYKLAELLAECDAAAPISEEDRVWLNEPPVGREFATAT